MNGLINREAKGTQNGNKQLEYLSWRKLFLSKAKLKASSRTSGLMSGFAMVAMVEINLEDNIPNGLLIVFSLLTTILISVHVFALMISVCILPNIETVEQMHTSVYAQQDVTVKTLPSDSPHKQLQRYIETAWVFSTGLGTLLFLMEIPMLMWVKFYNQSKEAAIASTGVMVPVCILFVIFAMRFYRKLIAHKYDKNSKEIEELQMIVTHLNEEDQDPLNNDSPHIK